MCFGAKICNSKLFSSLSDGENHKQAIRYVCAIKNELVCRTVTKVSLTYCNDPKDHPKHKFRIIEKSKSFWALANINCWFAKSFFLNSFGDYFAILRENREKWRSSSFFAITNGLWYYPTPRCTFLESLGSKQQVRYPLCYWWKLETEATATFYKNFL